ncbi:MAG TPA: bifunctional 2-polyprenyl-6-hydroxyphenol methylase/3-demethylubiquinol 3-O-methyltransferase UbiG [Rhizomicrobium sp.]
MPPAQRRSNSGVRATRQPSVDPDEVEKFSAISEEWWEPSGKFAALHRFNPLRLGFIRQEAIAHFGRDDRSLQPFEGLALLDIGCGGGLLSEPMARLGFDVTGVDASQRNTNTAALHAKNAGLAIDYHSSTAETLAEAGAAFDVVLNMEVVEHVANVDVFLGACATLVRPGGLIFVATINRTLKSLAFAKFGAEYVLGWVPQGTHDWNRFVPPRRLRAELARHGLTIRKCQGVGFDPLIWNWQLTRDMDINYMVVASRPNSPR